MTIVIGELVGQYRIEAQLGQGGMATVYRAHHASLDRYVAIKVLHATFREDPTFLSRFQREARVVAKLEHPNIVPVYDFAEHEGQPYLVMKFIEGETLKARLAAAPLTAEEILRIADTVGSALSYAHSRGILHRDIKPSNIVLAADGQIFLADFGLARIAQAGESTLSQDSVLGTPNYISPEQAQGVRDLDARTDIYSFGVVLYEMLVGRVPFSADTPFSVIHDHIFTPLPLPSAINPNVPGEVEDVLLKALAKNRDERFGNALELVAAYREAAAGRMSGSVALAKEAVATAVAMMPAKRADVNSTMPMTAQSTVQTMKPEADSPPDTRPSRRAWIIPVIAFMGIVALGFVCLPGLRAVRNANNNDAGAMSEVAGWLTFRNGSANLDLVQVTFDSLPALEDGEQYEVWLLGADGESRLTLGTLVPAADERAELMFVDDAGRNLLGSFDSMEVTVESAPDANSLPSDKVMFSSALPPRALVHVRHLLVAFDGTPRTVGLVNGLLFHAEAVYRLAAEMLAAQKSNNTAGMTTAAENIVNMIEGINGTNYGDHNGDGLVTDSGDGFGLLLNGNNIGYVQGTLDHARLSASAPDATDNIKLHGDHVMVSAQNVGDWAAELRDLCLRISASKSAPEAAQQVRVAVALADRLLQGQDTNSSESVEPIAGEGGAFTAFQHAQYMGDMQILPGRDRQPGAAATAAP